MKIRDIQLNKDSKYLGITSKLSFFAKASDTIPQILRQQILHIW